MWVHSCHGMHIESESSSVESILISIFTWVWSLNSGHCHRAHAACIFAPEPSHQPPYFLWQIHLLHEFLNKRRMIEDYIIMMLAADTGVVFAKDKEDGRTLLEGVG